MRPTRLARLAIALALASVAAAAAKDGGWVVRVPLTGPPGAEIAAGLGGELAAAGDLWGIYPEAGFAQLEVDAAGFARLVARDLAPTHDWAATGELATARRRAAGTREKDGTIAGFPCYRTVEATLARGAELAAAHPTLASWLDIGDSWEKTVFPGSGYDLQVLRLAGPGAAGSKPVLFVSGGIHPREYASAELATRFAEELVEGYDQDAQITALLDRTEVHVLFQANPDGRKKAETGLSWRKNTNNLYCPDSDDRGADLNRNFSFEWGCCAGSSDDPCSPIYRGTAGASEPEIDALEAYLRVVLPDQRPDDLVSPAPDSAEGLMVDLHSPGELVLSPWGFATEAPPNGLAILALARRLAFPGNYFPRLGSLGIVDGASKDFAYGELGVPAYTLELGVRFFEPCPFFDLHLAPKGLDALSTALALTRRPYLEAIGPASLDLRLDPPRPIPAGMATVSLAATLDDTRFAATNGTEPSEAIAAAEACIDLAPWEPGTTCVALAAADGAFDEPVEVVGGTLPTGELSAGRHTVFVRGRDAADHWGAPTAVFLTVLDDTAGKLVLRLLDGDTLAPLDGTLSSSSFELTTAEDGSARVDLPGGLYSLTASAPGFAPSSLAVELPPSGELQREIRLSPFAVTFADDGESPASWTADPPWALTTESASSASHSWTDSPGGSSVSGADVALTSPVLDLRLAVAVELGFEHRFDLVQSFDLGQVEISSDGGSSWETVAIFTGTNETAWRPHTLALPGLAGAAAARIRFRLTSRALTPRDGWYLDDVVVRAARLPAHLFADGFETGTVERWSAAAGLTP